MSTKQEHLEALQQDIVQLFAEIDVATYLALKKIAAFDAAGGATYLGYQSTPHWLSFRCGLSMVTAREHVRVARALETLPRISEAMASGMLSFSKVRAMTRIATPENEETLVVYAETGTAAQLERVVRGTRMVTRDNAATQHEARSVSMGFDEDGMFFMHVRLMADEGVRVMSAIKNTGVKEQPDALLAAIAEQQKPAELVVHVEVGSELCRVETPRGDKVSASAESARRLACDASVVVMAHATDGSVLDVGRKTRQIPVALKRALRDRDGGCRYPGCPNRIVDAHHIEHWCDGGETKLSNLVQLCRFHHGRLHEGDYSVTQDGRFLDPHGRELDACGKPVGCPAADWQPRGVTPWPGVDSLWRYADIPRAVESLVRFVAA